MRLSCETVWALSYRFIMNDTVLLFAGDTTIYREWVEWVHAKKNDLLILPINGRDEEKEKNGIVGNMNFCEALLLAYGTRGNLCLVRTSACLPSTLSMSKRFGRR